MHIATCYHRLIYRELGALPWRENQTPQSRPIAMVSSISAYFFNTSVRYSGGIETACAAIWASIHRCARQILTYRFDALHDPLAGLIVEADFCAGATFARWPRAFLSVDSICGFAARNLQFGDRS